MQTQGLLRVLTAGCTGTQRHAPGFGNGELHSSSPISSLVMLCNPFTDIKYTAMIQSLVLIHIVATFCLE
jgi:hypothetical protein